VTNLLSITVGRAGALGNLEEFFRPFLGRRVSTDGVHGSTRVLRKPEGDYGIVHPLHCRFAGYRRTSLVPGWIHPGSQTKAQNHWFAVTSGKQRYQNNKTAQANDYCFSRSAASGTASQRCAIPKVRIPELAHSCRTRDVVSLLNGEPQFIRIDICNVPFEFRDSENGVCRALRDVSTTRLPTQSSNLTLNHKPCWLWSRPGGQDLRQFCPKAGFINEKIVHD
jgi:hypothetical protein